MEAKIKPIWRVALALLCALLLSGGTFFILFSWRRLQGTDDAELAGWCVLLGLGLSGAAAFVAEAVFFPKSKISASELRFIVLHHEGIDDPHFDLMLETAPGSPLATWRSPVWPIVGKTALLQLDEHRRAYLQYEGEISGGRGSVRRVREGTYTIDDEPLGNESTGTKRIALHPGGERIVLRRINGRDWEARIQEPEMGAAKIKGAADLSESTAPREGAK